MQVTLTANDVESLDAANLDDLYAHLALADAGTQAHFGVAMESLASVQALMAAPVGGPEKSLGGLVDIGKKIFNRVWPTVKAIVCKIYGENDGTGDLKGWISAAATAIASLLGIAGPIAVLIVTIAIKLGLGALCDAGAPSQPA